MKRIVAALATLFLATPLLASVSDPEPAQAAGAPAVKVLSYNVRGPGAATRNHDKGYYTWEHRKEKQVRLVLAQNPAIFGLQEASSDTKATPKVKAKHFLVPRYAKAGYASYVPKGGSPKIIFWKKARFTKVTAGSAQFGVAASKCPQPGRSMAWVRLREIKTGQFYFIANAHLATTDACRSTRVRSARLIHQTIQANANKAPVILMGDFNNRQPHCYAADRARLGKAITVLDEKKNSAHTHNLDIAAAPGCKRTTHGNWPRATPGRGTSRIDFLFHSKGKLKASNYRVVTKRTLPIKKRGKKTGAFTSASDHYPIVATFKLR